MRFAIRANTPGPRRFLDVIECGAGNRDIEFGRFNFVVVPCSVGLGVSRWIAHVEAVPRPILPCAGVRVIWDDCEFACATGFIGIAMDEEARLGVKIAVVL